MKLNAWAPSFKPSTVAPPKPYPNGVTYDGTDIGALMKDYFVLETVSASFRTTLPHAHITVGMDGSTNVSYTSRLNVKIGTVSTETHWSTIKADSAPIYSGLFVFFGWQ